MNQKTFDDLLQKSRNQAPAVLFGGDLQGNTDTYLKPTNLNSQEEVPAPPKPLFREEGATVDLDKRMMMVLQPQVPRDPELEALNSYFNQRRVDSFVAGQSNQIISERLQKQAEITATQAVRDEMDRRAGIRRQVLDMTGLTPAQIDQQLVAESFAGINPRTMDMRERQVQDAVARFYNIQNIPAPATEATTNPVAATIPTIAAETQFDVETETEPEVNVEQAEVAVPARQFTTSAGVMSARELADFIISNAVIADETVDSRTGRLLSANTLKQRGLSTLRRIVEDYLIRRSSAGGGGGGGVGNPRL